jgi:hypothetical protein
MPFSSVEHSTCSFLTVYIYLNGLQCILISHSKELLRMLTIYLSNFCFLLIQTLLGFFILKFYFSWSCILCQSSLLIDLKPKSYFLFFSSEVRFFLLITVIFTSNQFLVFIIYLYSFQCDIIPFVLISFLGSLLNVTLLIKQTKFRPFEPFKNLQLLQIQKRFFTQDPG